MKVLSLNMILFASMVLFSCSGGKGEAGSNTSESATPDSLVQPVKDVSQVVGVGMIVPRDLVAGLSARKPGIVTHIYKQIGDHVAAGDPIVQLDDRDEQLALEKLQQQKRTQAYQVDVAAADLENTRTQLAYNKGQLETSRKLLAKGAETRENTDALENQVATLETSARLKEASLGVARTQLAALDTQIKTARHEVEKMVIRAPADGQVLEVNAVLYSLLNANQQAVTFAADGPVMARCEIDEMFADKVKPGQAAEIRYVGFSKVIATGKVTAVSPYLSRKSLFVETPTDQQDRRVRDVRITIDNPSGLLFNSRVECSINVK